MHVCTVSQGDGAPRPTVLSHQVGKSQQPSLPNDKRTPPNNLPLKVRCAICPGCFNLLPTHFGPAATAFCPEIQQYPDRNFRRTNLCQIGTSDCACWLTLRALLFCVVRVDPFFAFHTCRNGLESRFLLPGEGCIAIGTHAKVWPYRDPLSPTESPFRRDKENTAARCPGLFCTNLGGWS